MRRLYTFLTALRLVALPAPRAAAPPRAHAALLGLGGAHRRRRARPAADGPAGGDRAGRRAAGAPTTPGRACRGRRPALGPARVPSVFDARALASLYPGSVRRYRVDFKGPRHAARLPLADRASRASAERPPCSSTAAGSARNTDPYTPVHGRRARAAARARPTSWSWSSTAARTRTCPRAGGTGAASSARSTWSRSGAPTSRDLGTMSEVTLPRAGRPAAAPRCCWTACCERSGTRRIAPRLEVRLRSPRGRMTTAHFRLGRLSAASGGGSGSRCRCRRPQLWSPERPAALLGADHAARPRRGPAGGPPQRGSALGHGQARAPVPEQPPRPAARRLDPRGHAGPRRRAHAAPTWTGSCATSRTWARTSRARTTC